MATTAELAASIGSLIATQEKAFAIVNGPATGLGSTVTVASGVVPTFAKLLGSLGGLIDPTNTVLVSSATTDALRGTALRDAYTAAKLLTPNGSARSANNRVQVILPPGKYKLTTTLLLNANFVDILPLVAEKPCRRRETDIDNIGETSPIDLSSFRAGGTLVYSETDYVSTVTQTANDIRMSGFSIAHLGVGAGFFSANQYLDALDWGALLIGQGCANSPSQYSDMYFWSACSTFTTCGGVRAYESFSGTWMNCVSNSASFRAGYGNKLTPTAVFSANMYDCDAGPFSYIGDYYSNSSDYTVEACRFERCKSLGHSLDGAEGTASFAGCNVTGVALPATAIFVECESGSHSFGIGNVVAATLIRCRAGKSSAGSTNGGPGVTGSFSGYAEDCFMGADSFGGIEDGTNGKCTGTLVRCSITGNTRSMRLEGATIRDSRITCTTTGIHAITLLDSNSVISNSDIIVSQGGSGIPIYAATAKNVVAVQNRMNNATNDADGLGPNVTNLVSSAGNAVSNAIT